MSYERFGQYSEKPLVYMRFRPAWTFIDGIREFGRFFCERTFAEPAVAERATMVIQETLENAVKYSIDSPNHDLELSLWSDGGRLEISITSTPSPEHFAQLRRELEWLYSRAPEEAYVAAFERAASDNATGSRLGLARVRHEGNVDLTITELENGRVMMTARGVI